MSETVVISGAAALSDGAATELALLSVPDVVEVTIADRPQGPQVILENRTGARLRVVDGAGELTIAQSGRAARALRDAPGSARLALQLLCSEPPCAVTVVVALEPSGDGPIAVGHAIGGLAG